MIVLRNVVIQCSEAFYVLNIDASNAETSKNIEGDVRSGSATRSFRLTSFRSHYTNYRRKYCALSQQMVDYCGFGCPVRTACCRLCVPGAPAAPADEAAAPSGDAGANETLVYAVDMTDLITLDPAVAYEFGGIQVVGNVYEIAGLL